MLHYYITTYDLKITALEQHCAVRVMQVTNASHICNIKFSSSHIKR